MTQSDERVVVPAGAAPVLDLAVDMLRRAEELERLVDEVRAEIDHHAAAFGGRRGLPPGVGPRLRSPPFEARFEPNDFAEPSVRKKSF